FQNAALQGSRIPLVFEALDVTGRELRSVLRQLKASNAAGNVTIPHKVAVHDLCDDLTDLAAKVGAVNTFWFDSKNKLHGDNTDVGGFDAAARALLGGETAEAHVLVPGAGGAAAAVLAAVEEWPDARATIVARHTERAYALAK